MSNAEYLVVGGDVGGTNCRLALYKVAASALGLREGVRPPGEVVFKHWYPNQDFDNFITIMRTFFKDAEGALGRRVTDVASVCLAVAGPVTDNEVIMTNKGWVINGFKLSAELFIPSVILVNDFVAQGYGLLTLDRDDKAEVTVLQEGTPQYGAPIACIGAGTGLGECFLTPGEGGHYVAYPTEGGHAEFPPRTETEYKLLGFLKKKFEQKHRVSVERVVSGPGICNVFEFLVAHYPERVDRAVQQAYKDDKKAPAAVVARNSHKPDSLAAEAMDIFAGAYGAEAGVACLKYMPFGGLFITGGLTPKNIDRIQGENSVFMQAFRDKGRVSSFIKKVPVYAVMVEDLGERGALWVALKMLLDRLNKDRDGPAREKQQTAMLASAVAVTVSAAVVALAFLLRKSH